MTENLRKRMLRVLAGACQGGGGERGNPEDRDHPEGSDDGDSEDAHCSHVVTCTNPDCPCPDCIEFKADQNNDYSEEERRRIKAMCGTKRIRAKIARKKIVIKRFQRRNEIYDLNCWHLYQRDGMTEAEARERTGRTVRQGQRGKHRSLRT